VFVVAGAALPKPAEAVGVNVFTPPWCEHAPRFDCPEKVVPSLQVAVTLAVDCASADPLRTTLAPNSTVSSNDLQAVLNRNILTTGCRNLTLRCGFVHGMGQELRNKRHEFLDGQPSPLNQGLNLAVQ
jgi:hypothetical protein